MHRDTPRSECGQNCIDLGRVSIPPTSLARVAKTNIREELLLIIGAKAPLLNSTAALLLSQPLVDAAENYISPANDGVTDGARTRDLL
jgi:hypothetical protein